MTAAPPRTDQAPAPAGDAISQAGEQRSARVESLRAIGALFVAWFHIYAVTTGFQLILEGATAHESTWQKALTAAAQCGFFLLIGLSGALLFWPFVRQHWGGGDAINLRRYASNRALRVLPLYYIVVVTLLLIQENGGTKFQWTRFMTMTENFFEGTVGKVDTPMWSVAVEVQFYILLPLVAWGIARIARGSLRRAAGCLLVLGAALIAVRYWKYLGASDPDPLWHFSLPVAGWFFIPGMLVSLLRLEWQRSRPAWLDGPLGSPALWLAAVVPLWALIAADSDLDPLGGLVAFLVIGAAVLPLRPSRALTALSWRPLATVGVASYSLYLWHAPVLRLLKSWGAPDTFIGLTAVGIPAAIAVALLSYRLIEAPFLGMRTQWARSSARQLGRRSPERPAPEVAEG